MSKKKTYSVAFICPNCIRLAQLEIPMGTPRKDYIIDPTALCSGCGCRLDGKPVEKPKPPEPKTAGEVWTEEDMADEVCEKVGCETITSEGCTACVAANILSFDLGRASLTPETAMTVTEWLGQRSTHLGTEAVINYRELNKGKVI